MVDGTGGAPFTADVLVRDGRIAAVERVGTAPDAHAIDCAGLTVAPGFIDAHSHSDLQVLENRPEKALQGVTSEVVGNCGFSAYPAARRPQAAARFRQRHLPRRRLGLGRRARIPGARRSARLVHVESLVGHGTLADCVCGHASGPLSTAELDGMEHALDESLAAGACGFSTGLMYVARARARRSTELERLCRVVARRNKVYATHMRDYGFRLSEPSTNSSNWRAAPDAGCRFRIFRRSARPTGAAGAGAGEDRAARATRASTWPSTAIPTSQGSTVLSQLLAAECARRRYCRDCSHGWPTRVSARASRGKRSPDGPPLDRPVHFRRRLRGQPAVVGQEHPGDRG